MEEPRHLRERDVSRATGDRLAQAVVHQLADHDDADLAAALIAYGNDDGPCWALPPGEVMITRYDWTWHRTIPVAVFADKAQAEVELERLKAEEVGLRLRDKQAGRVISRPHHYALAKRW